MCMLCQGDQTTPNFKLNFKIWRGQIWLLFFFPLDRVLLVPLLSIGGVRLCSCSFCGKSLKFYYGNCPFDGYGCLLLFGINTTTVMTLSM